MERSEKRAIQREIYSQVARRFGVKSFKRTGSVSVTEEWMADGSVSRTTKIDESNPGDAELLIKMLSLAPPQDDSKQQPVAQTPSVEKPKADTPVSPKGDKAEMPGKKAEQAPGMPEDDQEDIQDRVQHNSMKKTADIVDSYLGTALWSSMDDETPMDQEYSISDIAPEDRQRAQADCDSFFQKAEAAGLTDQLGDNWPHYFWLTRNGHGAGFWDGDYPKEVGDKLTEIAKSFGSCDMYVGDDQKIYLAMKRKTADENSYVPPFQVGDQVVFNMDRLDGRWNGWELEWGEAGTVGTVTEAPEFGKSGDLGDDMRIDIDGQDHQCNSSHLKKIGSKKTMTMANKKIGMKLMANEPVEVTGIDDTTLQTWFERDRAHVALVDAETEQNTIVEWWDEAVAEATEDGFLDPRDYKQSAYDYAKQNGLLKEVAPKEEELGEDIFE
jgi:hypothetical protein